MSYIAHLTLADWKERADKGVWTEEMVRRFDAPNVVGRHYMRVRDGDLELLCTEGRQFIIDPTDAEIEHIAATILRNINNEKIRGYHPWQFSGSYELDDQTLITATTRDGNKLDVEIRFFETVPPRWSVQIPDKTIRRVSYNGVRALENTLRKLFFLMCRTM